MNRAILTKHQAVALLLQTERVHTFLSGGFGIIGCEWDRADVIMEIERECVECELAGPVAMKMGHGLAITRPDGPPLFVEAVGCERFEPKETNAETNTPT